MNYKQFIFAREYRGLTQTQLSNSVNGLSQSNLSKFEKGFDVLSDEIKMKIIESLDFPVGFFHKKINNVVENANYRKKASINKADIQRFENKCKLIGNLIDEMSDSLEWIDFNLIALNVEEGYSPSYVAKYNRKILGVSPDEPIKDIFSLIERNGIILYELDEVNKFDGLSFISDKGYSIIIVNKNVSNDRKRFTVAHELGHLLLHNESNYPISENRDREKEANEFASEFLMPSETIRNSLYRLKLRDLPELKKYWFTSMSSILMRAKNLNTIGETEYKNMMIEMSRYGYLKCEPISVPIDKPQCLENGYLLYKKELSYNINDFVNVFSLPKDFLDDVFNTKVGLKFWINREKLN